MTNVKVQDQNQKKKRLWQAHINAWERSGFSQNEYCRRNKLKPNQFCYWKKKMSGYQDEAVKFVPVTMHRPEVTECPDHADSGLTISFDKITIRLKNDFNPSALTEAIRALGGNP